MTAVAMTGPEIAIFRDVPLGKLELLSSLGARALTTLEDIDVMLQSAEQPMPVLSVSVNHVRSKQLPAVWMGMGRTELGKGLQYAEDAEYTPRRGQSSERTDVPGLAIPVDYDSVSTVKFFPFALRSHASEVPNGWMEHWQRHRVTQRAGNYKYIRHYEDGLGFPPFATWVKPTPLGRFLSLEEASATSPQIITGEPDASETILVPIGEHGRFYDDRHKSAIFLGEYAVQSILDDPARIGVPRELTTDPFNDMMTTAAKELGLEYNHGNQ